MREAFFKIARSFVPRSWRIWAREIVSGNPDEIALIGRIFERPGQMVDVGAHFGGASEPFLRRGWKVLAFEPDTQNCAVLETRLERLAGLTLDKRAISDTVGEVQPFYISPLSSGISSLHHFHPSHRESGKIAVTTLDVALAQHGVTRIDFLKTDIEGLDLFALRGLSSAWPVTVVMSEFEDRKTRSLGYVAADVGDLLVARGYHVIVSLWHPIVEYGCRHRWRAFVRYPCIIPGDSWGNFLAFSRPEDAKRFEKFARRCGREIQNGC
jgi:FkbM family methyltransferase